MNYDGTESETRQALRLTTDWKKVDKDEGVCFRNALRTRYQLNVMQVGMYIQVGSIPKPRPLRPAYARKEQQVGASGPC